MSALARKLLRDLARERAQLATIALVMACGVAALVSMRSAYDSLRAARDGWYARARFGDVFVSVRRAPRSAVTALAALPGVTDVDARVVGEVRLDMPGLDDPAAAKVVSLPRAGMASLHTLTLTQGRAVDPAHADECLVHEAFARAWNLRPGDGITAVIQGRRQRLRVAGVALSPEFAYVVQPGALVPDDRRYGVLWMNPGALDDAFAMRGAFNDAVLRVERGASVRAVQSAVDRTLAPWSAVASWDRAHHASARWIEMKITQLRAQATVLPAVFLAVAALLVNMVLTRLLGLERERIATLKALGYTDGEIARHYLSHALLTGLAGALLGVALGAAGGRLILGIFAQFFRFPVLAFWPTPATVALGVCASLGASVLGALHAVRRAVSIAPAEAMRPAAPARYTRSRLDTSARVHALPAAARMVLRELARRPLRALGSAVAISLAAAVLIAGRFTFDALDRVIELQYFRAQGDDVTVSFREPVAPAAALDLARLPGVLRAEPQRTAAARLRHGAHTRECALLGLPADASLRRLVDAHGAVWTLPSDGLLLGRDLAQRLDLRAGDAVTVEDPTGVLPPREARVSALVDDLLGTSGYLRLDALDRLQRDGGRITAVALRVDPTRRDALLRRLKVYPAVASTARRATAIAYFREQLGRESGVMALILAAFASVIAVGVVYNNARIALSVRSRELATLRVLGFTRAEVSAVLLGEQAAQVALAIPLGLLEGRGLAGLLVRSVDAELFRLPLVVSRATYLFAVAVVLAASALSAALVRRRVDALDMVAVLKSRD